MGFYFALYFWFVVDVVIVAEGYMNGPIYCEFTDLNRLQIKRKKKKSRSS